MNILYNKKKTHKARFIEGIHKMIRDKMIENKATQEKINEFNKKIREDDGKLSLLDLKKLDSVYKREYIKMVVEKDDCLMVTEKGLDETNRLSTLAGLFTDKKKGS